MNLTYIAWPLTLTLAFTAGSMINSPDSTTGESVTIIPNHKPDKPSKFSNHRKSNKRDWAISSKPRSSHVATPISKIKDFNSRMKALVNTVDSLSSDELKQLLVDFAAINPSEGNTIENRIIINALVSHGATEAMEFIRDHRKLNSLLEIAVESAARLDPAQTVDWVKGSPGKNMMFAAIRGVAENDVRLAMSMVEEVDSTRTKGVYADQIMKQLLMLPTREAWDWISSQIPNATYNFIDKANSGQIKELALLVQNCPDKSWRQSLTLAVARKWSKCDPELAKNWITSHQPQEAITIAKSVIGILARQDPEGISEWIQQFASANERSFAIIVNNYIWAVVRSRPDLAASQLKHYTGDSREMIPRIYAYWKSLDPGAAEAFRDSHNLK